MRRIFSSIALSYRFSHYITTLTLSKNEYMRRVMKTDEFTSQMQKGLIRFAKLFPADQSKRLHSFSPLLGSLESLVCPLLLSQQEKGWYNAT